MEDLCEYDDRFCPMLPYDCDATVVELYPNAHMVNANVVLLLLMFGHILVLHVIQMYRLVFHDMAVFGVVCEWFDDECRMDLLPLQLLGRKLRLELKSRFLDEVVRWLKEAYKGRHHQPENSKIIWIQLMMKNIVVVNLTGRHVGKQYYLNVTSFVFEVYPCMRIAPYQNGEKNPRNDAGYQHHSQAK